MENWKPVVGYEGLYEVSDLGRIKSLRGDGRILKEQKTRTGYCQVWLYNGMPHQNGRKGKNYQVHRIVAEAFLENPNGLPEVNHINEDKSDNRAENLEWCTHIENSRHGTRGERIGEKLKNGKRSKTVCQYTPNGMLVAEYPSMAEVQRSTGFRKGNIWKQMVGKRETAYGYRWEHLDD